MSRHRHESTTASCLLLLPIIFTPHELIKSQGFEDPKARWIHREDPAWNLEALKKDITFT